MTTSISSIQDDNKKIAKLVSEKEGLIAWLNINGYEHENDEPFSWIPTETDCMDILEEWGSYKIYCEIITYDRMVRATYDGEGNLESAQFNQIRYSRNEFDSSSPVSRHLALIEALCWAYNQIKDKLLEATNE